VCRCSVGAVQVCNRNRDQSSWSKQQGNTQATEQSRDEATAQSRQVVGAGVKRAGRQAAVLQRAAAAATACSRTSCNTSIAVAVLAAVLAA
jgi:hypothetical protein